MISEISTQEVKISSTSKTCDMSDLKKAFSGKLVPQDPNDKPSVLIAE
jgi:hypothetical protein